MSLVSRLRVVEIGLENLPIKQEVLRALIDSYRASVQERAMGAAGSELLDQVIAGETSFLNARALNKQFLSVTGNFSLFGGSYNLHENVCYLDAQIRELYPRSA